MYIWMDDPNVKYNWMEGQINGFLLEKEYYHLIFSLLPDRKFTSNFLILFLLLLSLSPLLNVNKLYYIYNMMD